MYVVNILSNQINCLSGVVTNPHTDFVVILIIFSPEILNMQKRRYNAFLLCVIPLLKRRYDTSSLRVITPFAKAMLYNTFWEAVIKPFYYILFALLLYVITLFPFY